MTRPRAESGTGCANGAGESIEKEEVQNSILMITSEILRQSYLYVDDERRGLHPLGARDIPQPR